jgi:hypothetical protein
VLNDTFHGRYLLFYYALFFTLLLFLQPLLGMVQDLSIVVGILSQKYSL